VHVIEEIYMSVEQQHMLWAIGSEINKRTDERMGRWKKKLILK
jgi:hypothetical protein